MTKGCCFAEFVIGLPSKKNCDRCKEPMRLCDCEKQTDGNIVCSALMGCPLVDSNHAKKVREHMINVIYKHRQGVTRH